MRASKAFCKECMMVQRTGELYAAFFCSSGAFHLFFRLSYLVVCWCQARLNTELVSPGDYTHKRQMEHTAHVSFTPECLASKLRSQHMPCRVLFDIIKQLGLMQDLRRRAL